MVAVAFFSAIIGRAGFSHFINDPLLAGKPVILETPRQTVADDLRNISTLRELYHQRA